MASITCGNCRQTHTSVEQVRDCYAGKPLHGPLAQRFDLPGPWPQAQPAAQGEPNVAVLVERTAPPPKPEPVDEGYYKHEGLIYKVQWNLSHSHRYAKELNPEDGKWLYAPGALQFLRSEDALTKEQAAEFGHLYGRCSICGRTLTNEESIEAGIGPVCAGKVWG